MEMKRTMIFVGLSVDTIFGSFYCKSLRKNLWHINLFNNKFLIIALLFGLLAILAALYVPVFQQLLKTVPLNLSDWSIILFISAIEVFLVEITKYWFIDRFRYLLRTYSKAAGRNSTSVATKARFPLLDMIQEVSKENGNGQ